LLPLPLMLLIAVDDWRSLGNKDADDDVPAAGAEFSDNLLIRVLLLLLLVSVVAKDSKRTEKGGGALGLGFFLLGGGGVGGW
jgi:hypothetical protein